MIDIEVGNTFNRRSALFLTTGAVLTSVLILRMLQMQVFNYRDYKKKSENNSFRIQINMPERGKIYQPKVSLYHAIHQFIVSILFPKKPMIWILC